MKLYKVIIKYMDLSIGNIERYRTFITIASDSDDAKNKVGNKILGENYDINIIDTHIEEEDIIQIK